MQTTQPLRLSISKRYSENCPYLQEGLLGRGASGSVYKIKIADKHYALKRIQIYQIRNSEHAKALQLQISIMKTLNHPNIVKLYQVYETENSLELMMEYMPGGNMFQKIKQYERLPQNLARKYMKDIISAIQYIHSFPEPIIHRDIKPENLLLDGNGVLKLCDFGSAGLIIDNCQRSSFVGTPQYMAPEMRDHKGHSQALDLWCIGILLYEFLTGKSATPQLQIPQYISRPAQDLIKKILVENPLQRATLSQIKNHIWFLQQDYSMRLQSLSLQERPESIEDMKKRIKNKKIASRKNIVKNRQSLNELVFVASSSILSQKGEQIGEEYLSMIDLLAKKKNVVSENRKRIEKMKKILQQQVHNEQIEKSNLILKCKKLNTNIRQKQQQLQNIRQSNQIYKQYIKTTQNLSNLKNYIEHIPISYQQKILQIPSVSLQSIEKPISDYLFKWKAEMLQTKRNALIELKMIEKKQQDLKSSQFQSNQFVDEDDFSENMVEISATNLFKTI